MAKKKKKDANILIIDGALTIHEALDIYKKGIQALEGADGITLELSGVTDCDTAGVQLLYSTLKSAEESGKTISVPDLSKAVQDAADRIGLEWGMEMG